MNAPLPVKHQASQALSTMDDIERAATAIAQSGLFGIKTPQQAVALMLIAQAEGQHPAIAARDYHVIQGRPTLKADAMLARFQAAGGKVRWSSYTDDKVEAVFTHPSGGELTVDWTTDRAKQAKLLGKDNWITYKRAMMRSRVISEGVRTVYPGCISGMYTPEEIIDLDDLNVVDAQTGEVIKPSVQMPTSKSKHTAAQQPSSPSSDPHEAAPGADQSSASAAQAQPDHPLKDAQIRILKAALERGAMTDIDVKAKFGAGLDGLMFSQFNDVMAFIQNPAGK